MTAFTRGKNSVTLAAAKFLKTLALILLFYLVQVSVMPHLKVLDIMPNLLMVIIAIMTVSFGKLYAFITGALIGILLESMAVSTPLFYVVIYPALALLCAQIFADMSDVKREIRRIRDAQRQGEAAAEIKAPFMRRSWRLRLRRDTSRDLNAHLRILLNAVMLVLLYEGVMLIYIALRGIPVTLGHILRVLYAAMYTALCCLAMFPVRSWLGLYKRPRRLSADVKDGEITTDSALLRDMALVPDEAPPPAKKKHLILSRIIREKDGTAPEINPPAEKPEKEVAEDEN